MYLMYKDERELGYQQINLNSLPFPSSLRILNQSSFTKSLYFKTNFNFVNIYLDRCVPGAPIWHEFYS